MKNLHIYVTIGKDGHGGDEFESSVLYAGTSAEEASELSLINDSNFPDIEMQVWKAGIHVRTLETDRERRYKDWTVEFDLETKLKEQALDHEKQLARITAQLNIINGKGEDDS